MWNSRDHFKPAVLADDNQLASYGLLHQIARCQIAQHVRSVHICGQRTQVQPAPAITRQRFRTGPAWKSGGLVQDTVNCSATADRQPSAQVADVKKPNDSSANKQRHRDPFAHAQPITAGVGLDLIRRMGWREGQGLGRNGKGRTEPVSVAMRNNRAGLGSHHERPCKSSPPPPMPPMHQLTPPSPNDRAGLASHDERPCMSPPQPPPLPPTPPQTPPAPPVESRPRASKRQQRQQQRRQKRQEKAQQTAVGGQQSGRQKQMPNAMIRLGKLSKAYSGQWPTWRLVHEMRQPGGSLYLYSVTVMHCNYTPITYQPNRKLAKLAAAELALQNLDPDAAVGRQQWGYP